MCIKDNIAQHIETSPANEVFFISDFAVNGNDEFISHKLSELAAEGKIMRLANGIYYKPIQTRFGILKPGVESIVKAIARRDKAQILPSGAAAENILGLSTQVPMTYVYLTSGSARCINIDGTTVRFKRCVPKNFAYKGQLMPIIVQALKSIGQGNVTLAQLTRIKALLKEHPEAETFQHDLSLAPIWIKKLLRNGRETHEKLAVAYS